MSTRLPATFSASGRPGRDPPKAALQRLDAIGHAAWTPVEAGVVKGRTLTSWPSLQIDIRNAGGIWVEEEVHVDVGLVTSRKPDDLQAYCRKMIGEFKEGEHGKQSAA